jgi:hypothetical protein
MARLRHQHDVAGPGGADEAVGFRAHPALGDPHDEHSVQRLALRLEVTGQIDVLDGEGADVGPGVAKRRFAVRRRRVIPRKPQFDVVCPLQELVHCGVIGHLHQGPPRPVDLRVCLHCTISQRITSTT